MNTMPRTSRAGSWIAAPLLACLAAFTPSSASAQPLALSERQHTWQQAVAVRQERSERVFAVVQQTAIGGPAMRPPLALSSGTLPQLALLYDAPNDGRCRARLLPSIAGGALGGALGGWIVWFSFGGALASDQRIASREMKKAALIGAGVGTGYMLAVWAWQCKHPREPGYGPRRFPRD
jgi:hypothetical protein